MILPILSDMAQPEIRTRVVVPVTRLRDVTGWDETNLNHSTDTNTGLANTPWDFHVGNHFKVVVSNHDYSPM